MNTPKPLDQYTINHIYTLLTPLVESERARRSLLEFTFTPGHPILSEVVFSGTINEFLPHVVGKLHAFGLLEDSRPALWVLLETVRERVGLEQKHRIDSLRSSFNLPLPPPKNRLFFSYSRRNERLARQIVNDLNDAGLVVWYDRDTIKAGQEWEKRIAEGIEHADYIVFCLSPDAIRSENTRKELVFARKLAKPIFPLMLVECKEQVEVSEFEEIRALFPLHYIDFINPDRYGLALRELILSLPGYAPADPNSLERYEAVDLINPYLGLQAFDEAHAEFFHGRQASVQGALARLLDPIRPRLLAFMGASGSGKSSLVRAGVIPALRLARPQWETLVIRTGKTPLDDLADRLQVRLGSDAIGTRDRLRSDKHALDDIAAELMSGKPANARFVVVFDQFEEIFALPDPDRMYFLDLLLYGITRPGGRVQVLFTMRSDFFQHFSAAPQLARLVRDNLDIITEMTEDELREAIVMPARQAGTTFEDGLVDLILREVRSQPGSLPLLQYLLAQLFDRRLGRVLTHEAYEAIGGVRKALSEVADDVYNRLTEPQRQLLRRLLLRLVEVGDNSISRRRVARYELHFADVSNAQVDEILQRLTDEEVRLLVADVPLHTGEDQHSETYYEVSHEALLQHWGKLTDWIETNKTDLRLSSDLLSDAKTWAAAGQRDDSLLWRGARLALALSWRERGDPDPLQAQFIDTSFQHQQAELERERELQQQAFEAQTRTLRRTRIFLALAAALLLLAVGAGLLAVDRQQQAQTAAQNLVTQAAIADANAATAVRSAAEARSLSLASNAQVASSENEALALALAVEANTVPDPPVEAVNLLLQLAYQGGELQTRFSATERERDYVNAIVFSRDGQRLATGTAQGVIRLWDANTYELLEELDGFPAGIAVEALAFNPDGQMLLAGGGELTQNAGEVRLWNLSSGAPPVAWVGHSAMVNAAAFMPDGIMAYTGDNDGGIIVWEASSGNILASLPENEMAAFGSQTMLSPDGKIIYQVGQLQPSLRAWSWRTGENRVLPTPQQGGCQAVALHPDGRRYLCSLSALLDPALYLLDIISGSQITRYQPVERDVNALAFTIDGSRLASADTGSVRLWETESGTLIHTYNPQLSLLSTLAFYPDGTRLLMDMIEGGVGVWDTNTDSSAIQGEPLLTGRQIQQEGRLSASSISEIVYNNTGDTLWVGETNGLRAFDLITNEAYRQMRVTGGVSRIAVLSNADVIAGSWRGELLRFSGSDQPLWSTAAHNDYITSIAISADENEILTGSADGQLRVWNADDGSFIRRYPTIPYGVWGADYLADGGVAALGCTAVRADSTSSCTQQTLYIWDAAGELRYSLPISETSRAFALNPDRTHVLVSSDDDALLLYDAVTGDLVQRFVGHSASVYHVAFNHDGTRILSGGYDQRIILWNTDTGMMSLENATNGNIQRVAFAPGRPEFAAITWDLFAGGTDEQVLIWRYDDEAISLLNWVQQNRVTYTFSCIERARFNIAPTCDASGFAPSSTPFPTLTYIPTVDLTRTTPTPSRTPTATFTPVPTQTLTPTFTPFVRAAGPQYGALYAVQWSPDGTQLLAGDVLAGQVIVWDMDTGAELARLSGQGGQWSPTGLQIVTYGADRMATLWNGLMLTQFSTLSGHTGIVTYAAWSHDGAHLLTVSDDATGRVWNSITGELIATLSGHTGPITDAEWTADDSRLVTTSLDGSARVWDANSGEMLFVFDQEGEAVYGVAWSSDGSHLLTVGGGGGRMWNVETDELLHTLEAGGLTFDAFWSADGARVLLHTLDAPPSVWDATSGERLFALEGHAGLITQVAWSMDGMNILTAGADSTLHLWDGSTGAPLRTLDTRSSLWSAAYAPDNGLIATTSDDGTIRLWNPRTGRETQFIFPPAIRAEPNLTMSNMDAAAIVLHLR